MKKNSLSASTASVSAGAGILFFFLIFLTTTNKLLPIPIDKVAVVILIFFLVYTSPDTFFLRRYEFELFYLLLGIASLSYLFNFYDSVSLIIFFPILGCLFCFVIARLPWVFKILYHALIFHFAIGFIFYIASYLTHSTLFIEDMGFKGLPFIHVMKGFTPTLQVFGSFCLTWFIIYYERRRNGRLTRYDSFYWFFVALCLVLTLNRTSFAGFLIILAFNERRIFYSLLVITTVISTVFFTFLKNTFFSLGTLTARSELLEGFNKSFWNSYSATVYVFGRGNNQVPAAILQTVKWDFRNDIENGYAMILHTYGFLGLSSYMVVAGLFFFYLWKRQHWFLFSMSVYYFLFQPYFTQEFMSTSFYVSIATILCFSRFNLIADADFSKEKIYTAY